jgi:site-specific DNA recombinase
MLLVEKTDRLYRNQRDAVTLEDLDIEIHFVKEGEILAKNSKSQVKFMHDIHLAMGRNYSENLREEVKKGMCEKASQGTYPGRPPFGYRNNKAERTIEIHPEKAVIARRVFELYVSGRYSLLALSKAVREETGTYISKTNLHKMLTNPFYIGRFEFNGRGNAQEHHQSRTVRTGTVGSTRTQQAEIQQTRDWVSRTADVRS